MATPTQGERLASLERGLSDHESRCEERLADIKETVAQTQVAIGKLQWWIVGLIVTVAGGALSVLVSVVLKATRLS